MSCLVLIFAILLQGHISNTQGRIGCQYSPATHKICQIFHNSPAEAAGLQIGDIVIAVDGETEFDIHWGYGLPGSVINLTLERNHHIVLLNVTRQEF